MAARNILTVRAIEKTELTLCFAIRQTVFIGEQGVDRSLERDHYDVAAIHLLARLDGEPVGTGRAVIAPDVHSARIGRVAVLASARGSGVGAELMHAFLRQRALAAVGHFELHAQLHAIAFYQRLGYAASGEQFLEAGIPHITMTRLR